MPVFAGIRILGVNSGVADYRAPPGRGGGRRRLGRAWDGRMGMGWWRTEKQSPGCGAVRTLR